MGISPIELLESGSVNEPEITPENKEVIDMTVDESKTTYISEQKDPTLKISQQE